MRANRWWCAVFCVGLLTALVAFQGVFFAAHAVDVKELRQAERDMFGGKAEKAMAALENIKAKLSQAKQADPNNPQVKTYEGKFKKLVKDLERRTGKDLGGGSLTAAQASAKADLPPKPEAKPLEKKEAAQPAPAVQEAKPAEQTQAAAPQQAAADAKLPYNARRPAEMAGRDLDRIEGSLERLGDPNWNQDQLLDNMNKSLESARKNLENARAEAGKKGVTSHAEFDSLEARIQQAEQKIAGAVQGVAESKEAAAASANEVTADVDALKATYDRVSSLFQKATGSAIYYNKVEETGALIEEIEQFEKNDLAEIQKQMAAFGEKYGTTEDAIDQKADAMGYVNNSYRASFAYTELENCINQPGTLVRNASF